MVLPPPHGAHDELLMGVSYGVFLMTDAVEKATRSPKGDGAVVNTAVIIGAFLVACVAADLLANSGKGLLSIVEFVRMHAR